MVDLKRRRVSYIIKSAKSKKGGDSMFRHNITICHNCVEHPLCSMCVVDNTVLPTRCEIIEVMGKWVIVINGRIVGEETPK